MARLTLFLGALIPAAGLAVNQLFPPEHYGYLSEQALLLLFALAAWLLYRTSINAALFFWCASTQLPILAMIEYSYLHTGDWSVFILTPWVGLLIIGLVLKDKKTTSVFIGVALVANCTVGIICKDISQAGALCVLTLVTGLPLLAWCDTEAQKQAAIKKVEIIQRGLDGILETCSGSTES